MARARSGKGNSRTLAAAYALTVVFALVTASPAAADKGAAHGGANTGGSAANGGTQFSLRPVITGIACLSRCGARSASTSNRSVSVRESGQLKVRGRNLSDVRTVIFVGGPGSRDDIRVSPDGVGRMSVDVTVPKRASSGHIALATATYTQPSPGSVLVVHHDQQPIDSGTTGTPPSQGLAWPVSGRLITSPFGENRGDHYHSGIDIAAPIGTPVRAAAAGSVLFVGPSGGYGNFICIAHSTLSTCYAHLSEFLTTVGASVRQGQVVGRSGCTGNCTGPHLHFEVRSGTRMWATAVDPLNYLPGGAAMRPAAQSGQASAATYRAPLDYDLPVYGP